MPAAIPYIAAAWQAFVAFVGSEALATAIVTVAITASVSAIQASEQQQRIKNQRKKLQGIRDVTVRNTIAPSQIVYGKVRCSGPLTYAQVRNSIGSTNNADFALVMPLARHQCADIEDVWVDTFHTTNAQINWTTGAVTGGPLLTGGSPSLFVYKRLGTTGQLAIDYLTDNYGFDGVDSDFRGQGCTWLCVRLIMSSLSRTVFTQQPQNIHALVKGKLVYDPRRDPTQASYGGSGAQSLASPSTWEWSENPMLCSADYLTDARLGRGVSQARIDWDKVASAATYCDETVSVPGGTQKRFTCNISLFTSDDYRSNLLALLTSALGTCVLSGGKYRFRALQYVAPAAEAHFTADDFLEPVAYDSVLNAQERFNTVRTIYVDPVRDWTSQESFARTDAAMVARDGGEEIVLDLSLPATISEYEAQRIAHYQLQQSDLQLTATFVLNWKALRITAGDRFTVTLPDAGWTAKVFRCIKWEWSEDKGFVVTGREDDSSKYAALASGAYITASNVGSITGDGTAIVPAPTNLAAYGSTSTLSLAWTPAVATVPLSHYNIYASITNQWADAVKIGEVAHNSSYGSFTYAPPDNVRRYFWIRTAASVSLVESARLPNNDTSTITAVTTSGGTVTGPILQENIWYKVDLGFGAGVQLYPLWDTIDCVAIFMSGAVEIARRTLRGTLNRGAETITVAALSNSGAATTFSLSGDGTGTVNATITHTDSGVTASMRWKVLVP